MLLIQFSLGCFLIIVTVVVHGVALDRLIFVLDRFNPYFARKIELISTKCIVMVVTILCVFLSHAVQIWIWAIFYLVLDVVPDLESALYFSTSAFTTVGFGDIYLEKNWRLLSSFEAANGFILFGWSTAFIFEIMNRAYAQSKLQD